MSTATETLPVSERARLYLAELPGAQSGAGGHNSTFKAACVLLHGFALPEAEAVRLLEEEFNPRCSPRWPISDLRHKVQSAARARSIRPKGYLLKESDPEFQPTTKITREERAWRKKVQRDAQTAKRARLLLPKRLVEYAWPLAEILRSSGAYHQDPSDGWRELLHLFEPEDILWIGDLYQSGKPCFDALFRPAADWLKLASCPCGPLISASTFRPGTYQRSRDNVVRTPFLVVESDTLTRDEIGAVFLWLHAACQIPLRAIIDTGGKSLHGWFDQPLAGSRRDDLLISLKAMGCDPKPMSEPAMSRLPSARRDLSTGVVRLQRLLWVNSLGGEVEHVCHLSRARAFSHS